MKLALREAYPVAPVDPLSVSPDPGEMGQMYIGAREKYHDGMTLACAKPRGSFTYEEIKAFYAIESVQPGFSDVEFFDKYFETTPPDNDSHAARPGQTIDEYTLEMREKFIFPNTDQGHFDVWLPYDRSVAGVGRFGKHSFLWDGYHMAKGYAADERWDLVFNIVDNTEHQINKFGYPLNGSADFYATRAQPDYFAHMVRMAADEFGPEVLVRYLPAMERVYRDYWMNGKEELAALPDDGKAHAHRSLVRMPDGSFLNRYWDDGEGPRLESYKEDVELADEVIASMTTEDLILRAADELEMSITDMTELTFEELAELLDDTIEIVRKKVYKCLRLAAASGWDFSSRWLADGKNLHTINTTDILPVDHNSLLAYNEETLAMAYEAKAMMAEDKLEKEEALQKAAEYWETKDQRVAAINKYHWDPKDKVYRDNNFIEGRQTDILSSAMSYPLYAGISNEEQDFGVAEAIRSRLLMRGGVATTTTEGSTQQWDGEKVWAPTNWATVRGLARAAHRLIELEAKLTAGLKKREVEEKVEPLFKLAEEVKNSYMEGIQIAFNTHGIVPEKHRGDDPATLAGGGEYALVKALAMSMETWRAMKRLDVRDAADHLPLGRIALGKLVTLAEKEARAALAQQTPITLSESKIPVEMQG